MNALSAYGRLVWRPHTALHLYLVACLVAAAGMWIGWLHGLMGEQQSAVALRRTSSMMIAVPLALGALAVSPVRELFHAQFTWHLLGVRRHLGLALALIAVLSAALTVLGLSLLGWLAVPVVPALAVALFAFSLGLMAFDWMHPERALVRGALVLVIGALLFSEAVWSAASTWPVATTSIGLIGATWLLPQCISREALRHKGLIKVRRVMGLALALPLILCSVDFASSVLETGSLRGALEHLHGSLTRPDAPARRATDGLDFALAMGGAMLLLFSGPVTAEALKPARLQPISRRERAEITWRLHLVVDLGVLGFLALGLFGTSELLALLGGFEGRGGPAPGWLRPIAVMMILAPLTRCWQHARRGLGTEWSRAGSMPVLALGVALIAVVALGLSMLWSMHAERLSAATWALVVLALIFVTQLYFRALLRRRFARCDLI